MWNSIFCLLFSLLTIIAHSFEVYFAFAFCALIAIGNAATANQAKTERKICGGRHVAFGRTELYLDYWTTWNGTEVLKRRRKVGKKFRVRLLMALTSPFLVLLQLDSLCIILCETCCCLWEKVYTLRCRTGSRGKVQIICACVRNRGVPSVCEPLPWIEV